MNWGWQQLLVEAIFSLCCSYTNTQSVCTCNTHPGWGSGGDGDGSTVVPGPVSGSAALRSGPAAWPGADGLLTLDQWGRTAGAGHGKEHLWKKKMKQRKEEEQVGTQKEKKRHWGQSSSSYSKSLLRNFFSTVEFLEKKTEQVHGRGAFSSPNSCWRSTSLSVRGWARMGVPSVAPG